MSGPCKGCGAPTSRRSTWCSQACNAKHRKKVYERTCIACGRTFTPASRERDTAKYCSRECRYDHKRAKSKNYPKRGRRALHRLAMEEKLGRKLLPTEVVHHKDENILNFDPDNLELKPSQSEHMREHWRSGSLTLTHERRVELGRLSVEARRRAKNSRKGADHA